MLLRCWYMSLKLVWMWSPFLKNRKSRARVTPLPSRRRLSHAAPSETRAPLKERGSRPAEAWGAPAPAQKSASPDQRPLGSHGRRLITGSRACGTRSKETPRGGGTAQELVRKARRSVTLAVASVARAACRPDAARERRGSGQAAPAGECANRASQTRSPPRPFPPNALTFPPCPLPKPLPACPTEAPGAQGSFSLPGPRPRPLRASSCAGLSPCASPGRLPSTYELLTTSVPLPLVRNVFRGHTAPVSGRLQAFGARSSPHRPRYSHEGRSELGIQARRQPSRMPRGAGQGGRPGGQAGGLHGAGSGGQRTDQGVWHVRKSG